MDIFTWNPSTQRTQQRERTEGVWIGGKYIVFSDFELSDTDKDSFLDFYGSHIFSTFLYFIGVNEKVASQYSAYGKSVEAVLAKPNNDVTFWTSATITEQWVDSGQDSVSISYDVPSNGTIRFSMEYVGDGDYVLASLPTENTYVKIFVLNSQLVCEARQENSVSAVEIDVGSLWNSPNIIMGQVISFALSWTPTRLLFAHNGTVSEVDYGFGLDGAEIQTLQSTYDIMLLDIFLSDMIKWFYLPFEDSVTITVSEPDISVSPQCMFEVKGNLGIPVNVKQQYAVFSQQEADLFKATNVVFEEV